MLLCCAIAPGATDVVHVTHVFKGRAFGSPSSSDIAKRIAVGTDGSLYIGGITTPRNGEDPWGKVDAGELTGKKDIFVAKVSSSGNLVWVTRTGSVEDDELNDMKMVNNSLYICGSTEGDFGQKINGSADAFVMKVSLDGKKMWKTPYQYGSSGRDECNSLDVDSRSGAIFMGGSTDGDIFGRKINEGNKGLQQYVARLDEVKDKASEFALRGHQRGCYGNCSGDALAVVQDYVYLMSTSWKDDEADKDRSTTYLNIMDQNSMRLHSLHSLKCAEGYSFRGVRMDTVNESGDAVFVGMAGPVKGSKSVYHVMRFSSTDKNGEGGIQWDTTLGEKYAVAYMHVQEPSVVVDMGNDQVYVAGTEERTFLDEKDGDFGVVSAPFFKLSMRNGTVEQRWHRTTSVQEGLQEVTDMAIDGGGGVVYTGAWHLGGTQSANALIGSFGGAGYASRMDESEAVYGGFQENDEKASEEEGKGWRGRRIGLIILGVASGGVVMGALLVWGLRWSGKREGLGEIGDVEDSSSEIECLGRPADETYETVWFPERSETGDNFVLGASAARQ